MTNKPKQKRIYVDLYTDIITLLNKYKRKTKPQEQVGALINALIDLLMHYQSIEFISDTTTLLQDRLANILATLADAKKA